MPAPKAAEARDAVFKALKLAGVMPGTTPAEGEQRRMLPPAQARIAVDRLADFGTIDKLTDTRPDMKALVADMLNWDGPKATKATAKAAARALMATDERGRSRYPAAVEVLSYATAIAPLLEPDRIIRVIDAVSETTGAYAPIRYPATMTAKLRRLIGHYQDARKELLLISLWKSAHEGRWWDTTSGLGRNRGRRRRRTGDDAAEDLAARNAALAATFTGGDQELIGRILGGEQPYYPDLPGRLHNIELPDEARAAMGKVGSDPEVDPDISILVAQFAELHPNERPESPIPVMVDALEFLFDEGEQNFAEHLPKKPEHWGDLYPKASLQEYPAPAEVLALDWKQVPGTGVNGVPEARVELIRTPHDLFDNRDFMGNCTGGYDARCQAGQYFIFKVHQGGELYNWSITTMGGDGNWRTGEINSRFNRGNVPQELRQGVEVLLRRTRELTRAG